MNQDQRPGSVWSPPRQRGSLRRTPLPTPRLPEQVVCGHSGRWARWSTCRQRLQVPRRKHPAQPQACEGSGSRTGGLAHISSFARTGQCLRDNGLRSRSRGQRGGSEGSADAHAPPPTGWPALRNRNQTVRVPGAVLGRAAAGRRGTSPPEGANEVLPRAGGWCVGVGGFPPCMFNSLVSNSGARWGQGLSARHPQPGRAPGRGSRGFEETQILTVSPFLRYCIGTGLLPKKLLMSEYCFAYESGSFIGRKLEGSASPPPMGRT